MTDEVMNIFQRMHAIMSDLKYIQKDQKKVAGQYKAVKHDDVSAAVHEMLVKHRVYCIKNIKSRNQDGNRTEVDLSLTFVNIDHPEDRFTTEAFGYGIDGQDKGPGKAISYAVKYGFLKSFDLETGDDPDNDQGKDFDHVGNLEQAIKDHAKTIETIKEGIGTGEFGMAAEAWFELTDDEKKSLWVAPTKGGPFTTEERKIMQTKEFRESHYGEQAA